MKEQSNWWVRYRQIQFQSLFLSWRISSETIWLYFNSVSAPIQKYITASISNISYSTSTMQDNLSWRVHCFRDRVVCPCYGYRFIAALCLSSFNEFYRLGLAISKGFWKIEFSESNIWRKCTTATRSCSPTSHTVLLLTEGDCNARTQ